MTAQALDADAILDRARPLVHQEALELHQPVFGHCFGQSLFATYALATHRNAVKLDKAAPLELLGPVGCSLQTVPERC